MITEITILCLMTALILLDAVGDAFRSRGWQIPHHLMEALHEGSWIGLLYYFTGWVNIIPVYILSRIAIFDVVYNLVAGNKLSYIGKSSIYGIVMTWFTGKIKEQGFLIWVIRAMALLAWIILLILNK